jgi:nucleoid DNA-binding protein
VPVDPVADVVRELLVELREVSRYNEPVVSDVAPISDCEWVGLVRLIFHRKVGEIDGLICDSGGIALHGEISFRKDLNYMRASLGGRDELAVRVQQALVLPTKKQAQQIVEVVIGSLESTLLNNLGTNGFTLKLGSFGKFSVRHKPGILRKIPFTGETILTKDKRKVRFVSLGALRQQEKVARTGRDTSRTVSAESG